MPKRKEKIINLFAVIKIAQQEEKNIKLNNVSDETAIFITKDIFISHLDGTGYKDKANVPPVSA